MAELRAILEKTASPNPEDQQLAYHFLKQAYESNYSELVKLLSELLRSDQVPDFVRQAAGLSLKNCLVAKEEASRDERIQKWLQTPLDIREYVKTNVLETLGTENLKPSQAAQCVASIACIELPRQQWQNSVGILMTNVTAANSTEALKESSLEALGYLCQDIDSDVLKDKSNEILTAIVHGMKKQEASDRVRLAATTALFNSLEFTQANFENENERHVIMQVVCEASQNPTSKVAALQCLVKIMSLYYKYMEHYMGPALFAITVDAMKSPVDDVALQGIEFWSNVCEEELDLAVEAEEAAQEGRPPQSVSRFYAKGALKHLIPILTETLAKQDEGDDEDEWNPHKAAGVCLMLLTQCVGDEVVVEVLPFVTTNIVNPDWRFREAAVMAFGSVLEGPDPEKLRGLVEQALPLLIKLLTDEHMAVRDTAAWCIGKVCDVAPSVIISPTVLTPLLPALSEALNQEPRVAANVCWAISSLSQAAFEQACEADTMPDDAGQPETYILSSCFTSMVDALVGAAERPDAHQSNLRIAAYEALMELIKNSPKDCYPTVQNTTVTLLKKIEQLLSMESQIHTSSDKSQFHDLQSSLCAALQSVLRKMRSEDAPLIADNVMTALTRIIQCSAEKEAGGVVEDALLAMATFVEIMGERFLQYMDNFKPYFLASLKNHAEYQVCQAAVGLSADLCRSLESKILPYLDEIMQLLLEILEDDKMEKSVKPQVLSTFGDVALAIGPEFNRYAVFVMEYLKKATLVELKNKDDYDEIEYFNQLRECCLEGYTGIIQGYRSSQTGQEQEALIQLVTPSIPGIISFLERIAADAHPSDSLLANAAGLIGDMMTVFGKAILPSLDSEPISLLLTKGRRAKAAKTKTLAAWATKEIKKLKNLGS